jgi:hypothetical protein
MTFATTPLETTTVGNDSAENGIEHCLDGVKTIVGDGEPHLTFIVARFYRPNALLGRCLTSSIQASDRDPACFTVRQDDSSGNVSAAHAEYMSESRLAEGARKRLLRVPAMRFVSRSSSPSMPRTTTVQAPSWRC